MPLLFPGKLPSARGGQEVAEGTGAPPLWGKAEEVGAVEAAEEKVVWRPQSPFPVCERATGKRESHSSSGTVVTGQGVMG